jgi:hypothetical protein
LSASTANTTVNYISTIKNVREIALSGTADLTFWQAKLRPQGLIPFAIDGNAALVITATKAKFMGIGFKEVAIAVAVAAPDDPAVQRGQYLAYAFNSSRLLAFAERLFFQTPYYPAEIEVEDHTASITVRDQASVIFKAAIAESTARERRENSVWEGKLFLPRDAAKPTIPGKYFVARLAGETDIYPASAADTLVLKPPQPDHICQELIESGFTANEWRTRSNAVHARSASFPVEG